MKVTRRIREYVEREIKAAYAEKKNPYTKQVKKDEEAYKAFNEKLNAKIKREADKFYAEHKAIRVSYSGGVFPYEAGECHSLNISYSPHSPLYVKEKEWDKKHTENCKRDIDEILLNLELGANREELNRALAEIIKKVKEEQK